MLPAVWKAEREAAALVLFAFRVLWLFCPQSAAGDVLQRDQNPFQVIPKSSTTCCRGERWVMENLVWSVWCRVAGESWTPGHYSVACIISEIWEAVFNLLQGHWATFLVTPTEPRRQSGSPWSGFPSWSGESFNDFYLYTVLFLSPCLLQVISRRNKTCPCSNRI